MLAQDSNVFELRKYEMFMKQSQQNKNIKLEPIYVFLWAYFMYAAPKNIQFRKIVNWITKLWPLKMVKYFPNNNH